MNNSKTFSSTCIASLTRLKIDKPTVKVINKSELLAGGLKNMEKTREKAEKLKKCFKEVLWMRKTFRNRPFCYIAKRYMKRAMKNFNTY